MDLNRLKDLMAKDNLDAVVAITPENVYYSSGAYIMTQRSIRDRLAITVFPIDSDPVFIVCGIEESLARADSWIQDIRTYVEFKEAPIDLLIDVLKEKNLTGKRIGMEMTYLNYTDGTKLTSEIPNATFIECQSLFDRLRMIKEAREIELLEYGAKVTAEAIDAAFRAAKPGDSEAKVARDMQHKLIDSGAEEFAFLVLGTGRRSLIIHPIPGETPLSAGDVVRVDFGGLFKGYYSDVARTVVVGEPTTRQLDNYRKLAEIERGVIEAIKPGIRFCDLFFLCKKMFEERGLDFFMPHIGHGMGLIIHENPMLHPANEALVEENMILNIEPLYIDKEMGCGYHIEDLVLVTADGFRVLTGSDLGEELYTIR